MRKKEEAAEFIKSERAKYIVAQALYEAIQVMRKIPSPMREESSISDMEFLLDNVFPHYKNIFIMQKEWDNDKIKRFPGRKLDKSPSA